jgi:SPP1 family predicted phage head-tail adaptor
MRAGRLDRRIDIQRKTATQDEFGQEVEAWGDLTAEPEWASVSALRGEERFTADQFVAREQVEFRVRWSQALADVNPLDRILYPPASASPADPDPSTVYDIMAVHELGRRQGLRILAARRAEQ